MAKITVYKIREDRVFDGDVELEVTDPIRSPIPPSHTRASPHPIPKDSYAVMNSGWKYIKGNKPPAPLPDDQNPDIVGAKVREQRNVLLTESDWTQLDDSPVTNDKKLEWASYRQELRNIPDQEGFPFQVVWPSKP